MKRIKFNFNLFHLSVYLTILIAYFMPFDKQQEVSKVGFLFKFLSYYGGDFNESLFLTFHFNILLFALNITIFYFVLLFCLRLKEWISK